MNAVATSPAGDNGVYGSDSDTSSDDSPEYYQPISAVENGEESESETDISDQDPSPNLHRLPNGWAENGLSSLDLSSEDGIDEVEAAEEEETVESERAIVRAFSEDERRRNAPLATDTAVRVMEAMRGVSFAGGAPEWASHVAEEEWVDRLRRLRGQQPSTTHS